MHTTTTTVSPTAIRLARILDRPTTAGHDALAAVLDVSGRTVARALDDLVNAGAVRRERRHDRAGHRLADRLIPTGQNASFGLRSKNKVAEWTPEVAELRTAMNAAGIRCGWGNLRPDVVADLTRWVRTVGIPKLVAEAKCRLWGVIRHVAAFLRFWRELRPERRPVCPFHLGESIDHGRRCPQCQDERAARAPMPEALRSGRWRRIRSDPIRTHPEEAA